MWCIDPDEAFDVSCGNLGCEDWCKDFSGCPLQKKGEKMFIIVKKDVSTKELENSDIVLKLSDDNKNLEVIKHRHLEGHNDSYHLSALTNLLLSFPKE